MTARMAKLWLIPLPLLLTALLVHEYTPDATRADFVYVNPSGIHTLDPARMSWTQDFRIALNVWEGLTSWDPRDNRPIGAAAEFPPDVSDDGLTYRFTIRSDARWSNGDPVTSFDFVRGWRRAMEPGTAADYSFLFSDHIRGALAYVRWRREAVGVLTTLAHLSAGRAVDAKRIRSLLATESVVRLHPPLVASTSASQDKSTTVRTPVAAPAGSHTRVADWQALYDEYFSAHVAQRERRFRDVGLSTPDARTLIVRLTAPCPYFLDLTGLPVFLPCHKTIDRLRVRYRAAPITQQGLVVHDPQWTKPDYHALGYPGLVTNGAYRIADWVFKRRLRLAVNPEYRDAATLACRTIEMRVFDNTNTAIMAYLAGDVDFLPSMSVSYDYELARLARTGAREDFHLCDVLATYYLTFNCADDDVDGVPNPFTKSDVRRAFALALDKTVLVERVLGRGDRVARSFVPPHAIPAYDPPVGATHDVAAARRLLRRAGYPNGLGLPTVDLLSSQRDARVLQSVARQWERGLGVRIHIRNLETKTFAEEKASRRFMIASSNWYGDYLDPTTFLECLTSNSGNNDGGYASRRYDGLLAEARHIDNPEDRLQVLARAEAFIVQDDIPIIPLLHYAEPIAIQPYVHGLYPNLRLWFPFRLVSTNR